MGRWAWIAVATLVTALFLGAVVGPTQPRVAPHGLAAADASVGAADRAAGAAAAGTVVSRAAGASPPAEVPAPTAADHGFTQEEPMLSFQQEFEQSQYRVRVEADGDAVWTFRYERPIDSDADRSSFQAYAERFRSEPTQLSRDFHNQSAALAAAASEQTGREMNATDVDRDAGIEQTPTREVGYVELSFRWTDFGRVEDGQVRVGDVFEGGLYLGDQQTLVFVAGDGVAFASVAPEGSTSQDSLDASRSVTWTGEREFADRHPRAVLDVEGRTGSSEGFDGVWMLGGGALVLALALAVVVLHRRELPAFLRERPPDTPRGASEGPAERSAVPEPTEPPSTLSDDQRVLELLHDADGRMKQSAIVEETEWSKSKVSMLLSDMEEEGLISKIQVGRENIIALEGHEPEAAGSPFDERE